ncbi:hypothetical protein [uncultured Christiangramia sp.]|uniref:hypothetical protein n=1 Tax=uncultured Christiangramia sp. TaxID=503836 RepID=UPI00260F0E38|nr:hypothetical protein [uncultured Christiangramia sp.]
MEIEIDNKFQEKDWVASSLETNFNMKFLHTEKIITNNRNEIASLNRNLHQTNGILQNTSDTVSENYLSTENVIDQIGKQIQNLSEKVIAKPRKSELRDEKVKVAKQQFEVFKSDLKKLPEFNSLDKKFDCFKDENLTELQTYQTALSFFKENYNLIEGTPKTVLYKLFNDYFNIETKKLKSSNWNDFRKRILPDIHNNNNFYVLLRKNLL